MNLNIGLTVETERGLLIVVVRDAGRKSAGHIESELTVLTRRVPLGTSTIDDLAR